MLWAVLCRTDGEGVCGNRGLGSFCAQSGELEVKLSGIVFDMFHLNILAVVGTMKQTKTDSV
jgi:hypothetical protein